MQSALNEHVLVLNRLWQAVNVCTARRALCLLWEGHVCVVHRHSGHFQTLDFADWMNHSRQNPNYSKVVHTVSLEIHIPKVVQLLFFDRLPRKELKLTRHHIFERDGHQCQYCGAVLDRRELNLDHVIPRDRGGQTSWENLVCSCIRCNSKKANRTPREAGFRLLKSPQQPRWRPFINLPKGRKTDESWRQFLDPTLWERGICKDDTSQVHMAEVI